MDKDGERCATAVQQPFTRCCLLFNWFHCVIRKDSRSPRRILRWAVGLRPEELAMLVSVHERYPGLLLNSSQMFTPKTAKHKRQNQISLNQEASRKTSAVSYPDIKDLGGTQRQWTPAAGTPRRQWKRCAGATGARVVAFGAAAAVPLMKL